MKLRTDLLAKLTPELVLEGVVANTHRYKPEPRLSKTGVGSLLSASTKERANEGKAKHGHNSETHEKVRGEWEETRRQTLTLLDTLDFLFRCHRSAPFLFFNGNTFAEIGRRLIDVLFARVAWLPDGNKTELTALPESLPKEQKS